MTAALLTNVESLFEHPLSLKTSLKVGANSVNIFSGNIERVLLDLRSYGFHSNLQISSFENEELDALFSPSNAPKEMTVSLTFNSTDKRQSSPLLELQGVVIKKSVKRVDQIGEKEASIRLYEISFCDHAQAKWQEHFPVNIYVNESMKDVIEQHQNPDISIQYNFPPLEKKHPILAFSLPFKQGEPKEKQTSFYSFLMWYLQKENGIWMYDYQNHSYSICEQKKQGDESYKIDENYVAPPVYDFPPVIRHNTKKIKHSPTMADIEDEILEDAFKSIRRDTLIPVSPVDFLDLDHPHIQSPVHPEGGEIQLRPRLFFEEFQIDKLLPGSFVSFQSDAGIESWSVDPFYKDKIFRIKSLHLEAHKIADSETIVRDVDSYKISTFSLLEEKSEIFIERPAFNAPSFPFFIHGTIFSDIGDLKQTTYKISQAEETPQSCYLVTVPLAGKEKQLIVPFTPDFMTGQYYFPFCKGEKVILAVYFQNAQLERVLDWQPLARLPQGVQGNQIMLASDGPNKYCFLKHEFEDLKNSVITLKQSSSQTQTQTIRMKEKDIFIDVEESGKKTISIQLNHDSGLTLLLEDRGSGITQEIILDGKSITQICKDKENTSQYVQKPESISLTCKELKVSADKIVMQAKDSIEQKGGSKVDIESPLVNIKSPKVKMG